MFLPTTPIFYFCAFFSGISAKLVFGIKQQEKGKIADLLNHLADEEEEKGRRGSGAEKEKSRRRANTYKRLSVAIV